MFMFNVLLWLRSNVHVSLASKIFVGMQICSIYDAGAIGTAYLYRRGNHEPHSEVKQW